MAYLTYTTEALVCGSQDRNTSDRSYLLFTRDGGMVLATARSVREERSKQRQALQDFSLVRVSLVRGKSGWRVGSVENEYNAFQSARSRAARSAALRIVKLLRQYVHGEEPHPALYADVRAALDALPMLQDEDVPHLAATCMLRMLHKLGYIATHDSYEDLLESDTWTMAPAPLPKAAERAVEVAQKSSHL